MVEGHSVHRIAAQHRARLVGKAFAALSPNGRFVEGAKRINGRQMSRIEAIGKNLLVFFGGQKFDGRQADVMHVHFGMAGRWTLHDSKSAPAARDTTRLTLEGHGIVSHLSAMTVVIGGEDLFEAKRKELGEDPLREGSDPERLWSVVRSSKKTIGQLLMDQGCFPGVGNIYRAEICFCSGIHPNVRGCDLSREQFSRVWDFSVSLLRRGFECGSILTVDPMEAKLLGKEGARRYVYAQQKCVRCETRVQSWDVNGRNCFACPSCQPPPSSAISPQAPGEATRTEQLSPAKMLVGDIRAALKAVGADTAGTKAVLVARLASFTAGPATPRASLPPFAAPGTGSVRTIKSAPAARREKKKAGESSAVEHIAEFDTTLQGLVDWTDLEGSARKEDKGARAKRKLGLAEEDIAGGRRTPESGAKPRGRSRKE